MAIYATTMSVEGISQSRYLINNPIFVDVENIPSNTKYLRISLTPVSFAVSDVDVITPQPFSARIRPFNGSAYFDLARYIKGMMPTPQHPQPATTGQIIDRNTISVRVDIVAVDANLSVIDAREFTRVFVRGGKIGRKTNVFHGVNQILKDSTLIPQWPGYPIAKYTINSNGRIVYSAILTNSEIEQRRVVGCNPVYIRYLNTAGGYSYWLFESYSLKKKTDKTEVIERRDRIRTTGNAPEYELTVQGRVDRRYFRMMRALSESPEVAVYKLENILSDGVGTDFTASKKLFTDVINNGNSIDVDSSQEVADVSMKFNLKLTHNPLVRW